MKILPILLLLALPLTAAPRVFSDTKGRPLTAELMKTSAEKVWLKLESGKTVAIAKATLSEADQAFITQWETDLLPDIKVEPGFVRGLSKDGDSSSFFERGRIQKFSMTVELSNSSSKKDLEETEVIYYLVGKSTTEKSYKILARQVLETTVPAKDKKTVTFKDIDNHYRDGQPFQTGHRGLGYVLLVQRKRDGRRIQLSSPTASLSNAAENIITLDAGDVTGPDFFKAPQKPNMRGDIKKALDVITIR
jgi:hypothetical protein